MRIELFKPHTKHCDFGLYFRFMASTLPKNHSPMLPLMSLLFLANNISGWSNIFTIFFFHGFNPLPLSISLYKDICDRVYTLCCRNLSLSIGNNEDSWLHSLPLILIALNKHASPNPYPASPPNKTHKLPQQDPKQT